MPVIAVTIVDQTVAVTQVGEIGPTGATGATGTVSAAGDGTAGAPGIAFASDTNTGLFRPGTDILAASTGGTERVRIDSSGNVGIGTTAPTYQLQVASTSTNLVRYTGPEYAQVQHSDNVRTMYTQIYDNGAVIGTAQNTPLLFSPNNTERVRIDSSGNVGIGTTTPNKTSKDRALTINGATNAILEFAQGEVLKGYIYNDASVFQIDAGPTARMAFVVNSLERIAIETSGHVTPGADNTQNFGSGSLRWATIYAGTGTINTSDERFKVIRAGRDLSEAEFAAWSDVRAIVYQDKDSFDRKGDDARLHVGYSWQAIAAAFTAQGLDANRYGLWCEDPMLAPVAKTRTAQRQATDADGKPITEVVPVLDDAGEPVVEQVQATEVGYDHYEEVRIIDGQPVLTKCTRVFDQPLFDSVQVKDEAGQLLFEIVQLADPETGEPLFDAVPVLDDDGEPVLRAVQATDPETGELVYDADPETGKVTPRMVDVPAMTQTPRMGPAPRMAQVPRMVAKAKTETVPVMEDFQEEFTEMEPTGETRGALRYQECAVLEAAWLRRQLALVEARLAALEAS